MEDRILIVKISHRDTKAQSFINFFFPLCLRVSVRLILFLLFFCSCIPKPVSMETGGITDALGRSYAQSEKPNRIVSLVPAVTEILFAIGAGEKVVGVTQYCDYPPEAKSKTSVGGFSGATVSMEIIRSLEPDLVILSAEMHARVVSLLDGLGISVFAVEPRDFFGVYDTIAVLGEISGCLSGAEDVINEMKNKIDAVEERIRGKEKPAVFWVLGEDPLMTAGGGTFVNEAINLGGGRNIFENIGNQWALVSFEQVLLGKPDWVLAGNDLGTDLLKNPLWRNIQAVREGRFAVVNADILYRYGPRLAEGVELLAEILHRIRI